MLLVLTLKDFRWNMELDRKAEIDTSLIAI